MIERPEPEPIYELREVCNFIKEKYGYELDFWEFITDYYIDLICNGSFLSIDTSMYHDWEDPEYRPDDYQEVKEYLIALNHEFGPEILVKVDW